MKCAALACSLVLWCAGASTASAQTVRASDPTSVAAAVQDFGYRAALDTDGEGDPKVTTSVAGINTSVFFYGCQQNVACRSLQLSVALKVDAPFSPKRANEWNSTKRFASMTIDDEGDPVLALDIETSPAGLDREVFFTILGNWATLVEDFKLFAWGN